MKKLILGLIFTSLIPLQALHAMEAEQEESSFRWIDPMRVLNVEDRMSYVQSLKEEIQRLEKTTKEEQFQQQQHDFSIKYRKEYSPIIEKAKEYLKFDINQSDLELLYDLYERINEVILQLKNIEKDIPQRKSEKRKEEALVIGFKDPESADIFSIHEEISSLIERLRSKLATVIKVRDLKKQQQEAIARGEGKQEVDYESDDEDELSENGSEISRFNYRPYIAAAVVVAATALYGGLKWYERQRINTVLSNHGHVLKQLTQHQKNLLAAALLAFTGIYKTFGRLQGMIQEQAIGSEKVPEQAMWKLLAELYWRKPATDELVIQLKELVNKK